METNRLRYFCAIAETGSLTKASEMLGVSHSGLSKAISVLENETNLKLFRPLGRGLEITQEGTWLYQKAQQILKLENEISDGVKVEKSAVRMGLSEVLAVTCASFIAQEFPDPISIIKTDVGEIEGSIISGEIDFGFIFSPSPKPDLEYLELGEIKLNSFARVDLLKRDSAENLPFVIPSSQFIFNPLGFKARDGWPQHIPRRPRIAVSEFAIALNLIRSGEAVVYMPNFVAVLENENKTNKQQIVMVPEHREAESKRKLFLVKSKHAEETKEMKKASKIFRRICQLGSAI